MKRHRLLIAASALAVLLSIIIINRAFSARSHFDSTVSESLKTTEGYDQRFIDMVNRLEQLLAERAQFGYSGGKDPMTGTMRQVVQVQPKPKPAVAVKSQRQQAAGPAAEAPPPPPEAPADQMRLTAIIADATGRKITAVIMDGERSYSVEQGDNVGGRKITRITNEGIYMDSDSAMYFYDIYGNVVKKNKEGGAVPSILKEEQPKQEPPKKMPARKPAHPPKKRKK
jgi:hypothetical protein